jgi:hypothetical protein
MKFDSIAEMNSAIDARAKKAFAALKEMGAPVYHLGEGWGGHALFSVSAEENYNEDWADYYQPYLGEFGLSMKIVDVLDKHGLYAEWCNPGVLDVYEI